MANLELANSKYTVGPLVNRSGFYGMSLVGYSVTAHVRSLLFDQQKCFWVAEYSLDPNPSHGTQLLSARHQVSRETSQKGLFLLRNLELGQTSILTLKRVINMLLQCFVLRLTNPFKRSTMPLFHHVVECPAPSSRGTDFVKTRPAVCLSTRLRTWLHQQFLGQASGMSWELNSQAPSV